MRRRASHDIMDNDDTEIDVTPMLDVVFIMLIFFIVTASFVKETGIDVNRPAAQTQSLKPNASIMVAIDSRGHVWIDKRQVEIPQIRANLERLHSENPNGSIIIQADKEAKTEVLVAVMDSAKATGISDIALATKGK